MTTKGTYSNYDFSETVNHYDSPINEKQIESVAYAYGDSVGGYGEWSGGFALNMKNGGRVLVTGWCDTSGWGCQDGMTAYELSEGETWDEAISAHKDEFYPEPPPIDEWDEDPIDLNRYLRGEIDKW